MRTHTNRHSPFSNHIQRQTLSTNTGSWYWLCTNTGSWYKTHGNHDCEGSWPMYLSELLHTRRKQTKPFNHSLIGGNERWSFPPFPSLNRHQPRDRVRISCIRSKAISRLCRKHNNSPVSQDLHSLLNVICV